MHTFYYPDHTRHDPSQLHQPDTPEKNAYYSEVAQRAVLIHDAIKASKLGPVISPGDFGIEPIGEIHEYGMLNLLQNAYRLVADEMSSPALIPDTFSVRDKPSHVPRSVWGLLGYYCFDTSCPIFARTWDVAYWAAQTAISAAALILAGTERVAYALCRPPGHHAASNLFGGFCYLNNAAIAANWLVQQGQRVAILDIDYHHGNGTQAIFYHRSDVLFCSIHADPFNEYPYYWGYADEYGQDAGRNYNFNFPLPQGTQESEYLHALDKALDKVRLFVPDVVVVSLGVDTAEGDAVGGFRLTTESFNRIGFELSRLNLPLVIIQEGGYLLSSLGDNVVAFLKGTTGR